MQNEVFDIITELYTLPLPYAQNDYAVGYVCRWVQQRVYSVVGVDTLL